MKKLHLLATVATTLLLAAGTASAQMKKDEAPQRAPAAQQNAPAEKIAPSMKEGKRKTPETTGQATKSEDKGKADLKASDSNKAGMKAETKKPQTTGQAPKASESNKTEMNEKSGAKSDTKADSSKSGASVKENATTKSGAETKSGTSEKSSESVNGKASTTGQGAAAGAANLSTEQRTKITTIFKQHKVEPAHLNISVHVGATVPTSVHFYPVPTEVVEVYPEWRGYDYILVGDEIIIINPRSHQIVAILEA
jgi:hypothetical protein